MRLVLATSPHVRHVAVLQGNFEPDPGVMYSFAPVGLLSLVGAMRRERPDVDCSIYDTNRRILAGSIPLDERFYDAIAAELVQDAPFAVGLMTECDSYHHILQICEAIKRASPECFVILGGPHASAVAGATMQACASVDAVVVGEGEITLPLLIGALRASEAVAGAHTRSATGDPIDGGNRDLVPDLDDLPMPAFDLYKADPGEEIFLEVGRGCPFKCSFCSTAPYWRRKHRTKSPTRIVAEVAMVQGLYGATKVHFTHDLFTAHRAWVVEACEALIAAGSPVAWTCSARTDTVDEELLALMARAGCSAIYFGIESGSERVLGEIGKAIPIERSFAALSACRRAGITPNVGFIIGFPTEGADSFAATFEAYERALRQGCRPTHVFAFCPFADSSIYPTLRELECNGHFVDLPLGAEVDARNRELVSSDSTLFGAFFRPRLPGILGDEPDAVLGADEFSPLVEAMLSPALALADAVGGMVNVFADWLPWIRARNDQRAAAPTRRSYGAPLDFADFLVERLADRLPEAAPALAAARLLRENLRAPLLSPPTTMANHRSLGDPFSDTVSLGTSLSVTSVATTLALEFDASSVLDSLLACDFPKEQSFFVWQGSEDGDLRLLRVSEDVHNLIERLRVGPRRVSDIVFEEMASVEGPRRGAEEILASAREAARQGLVMVGGRA